MLVTPPQAQAQIRVNVGEAIEHADYHVRQMLDEKEETLAVSANQRIKLCNAVAALIPNQMGPGKPVVPHPGQFAIRVLTEEQLVKISRKLGEPSAIPQRAYTAVFKPTAAARELTEYGLTSIANLCEQFVRSNLDAYNSTVASEHINLIAFDALLKITSAMVESNKTQEHATWTNAVLRDTQMLALQATAVAGSRMAQFGHMYCEYLCWYTNISKSVELAQLCAATNEFTPEQKIRFKALLGGDKGIEKLKDQSLNSQPPQKSMAEANNIVSTTLTTAEARAAERARARAKARAKEEAKEKEGPREEREKERVNELTPTTKILLSQPKQTKSKCEDRSSGDFSCRKYIQFNFASNDMWELDNSFKKYLCTYSIGRLHNNDTSKYTVVTYLIMAEYRADALIGDVLCGIRVPCHHWYITYFVTVDTNATNAAGERKAAVQATLMWPFGVQRGHPPDGVPGPPVTHNNSGGFMDASIMHSATAQNIANVTTPTEPNGTSNAHWTEWMCLNTVPRAMESVIAEQESDPLRTRWWGTWHASTECETENKAQSDRSPQSERVAKGTNADKTGREGNDDGVRRESPVLRQESGHSLGRQSSTRVLGTHLHATQIGPERGPSYVGRQQKVNVQREASTSATQDDGHQGRQTENPTGRLPRDVGLRKLVPSGDQGDALPAHGAVPYLQHQHSPSRVLPVQIACSGRAMVDGAGGNNERSTSNSLGTPHGVEESDESRRQRDGCSDPNAVHGASNYGDAVTRTPGLLHEGQENFVPVHTSDQVPRLLDLQRSDGSVPGSRQTHQGSTADNRTQEHPSEQQSKSDSNGSGKSNRLSAVNIGSSGGNHAVHNRVEETGRLDENKLHVSLAEAVCRQSHPTGAKEFSGQRNVMVAYHARSSVHSLAYVAANSAGTEFYVRSPSGSAISWRTDNTELSQRRLMELDMHFSTVQRIVFWEQRYEQSCPDRCLRPFLGSDGSQNCFTPADLGYASVDGRRSPLAHHQEGDKCDEQRDYRDDFEEATDQHESNHANRQHLQPTVQHQRRKDSLLEPRRKRGKANMPNAENNSTNRVLSGSGNGSVGRHTQQAALAGQRMETQRDIVFGNRTAPGTYASGHVRAALEPPNEVVHHQLGIGYQGTGLQRVVPRLAAHPEQVRQALSAPSSGFQNHMESVGQNIQRESNGSLRAHPGKAQHLTPAHSSNGSQDTVYYTNESAHDIASQGVYLLNRHQLEKYQEKGQVLVESTGKSGDDWRIGLGQFLRCMGLSEFAVSKVGARYKTGAGSHINPIWRRCISDMAKQQGRSLVLLDRFTLMDYAFTRFQSGASLIGRNMLPGFSERQAIQFFSMIGMVMNSYLEGKFKWDKTLQRDVMKMAKELSPIRAAHKMTFDLANTGPHEYKAGDGTSLSRDNFLLKDGRCNVSIWQQIQALGDNNAMSIEDLRDKNFLLLKVMTAGRTADIEIDFRALANQVLLYTTEGSVGTGPREWDEHPNSCEDPAGNRRAQGTGLGKRSQKWLLSDSAVIWISRGKTGTRSTMMTRIRPQTLVTTKISHLDSLQKVNQLDVFQSMHVYLERVGNYIVQLPRSIYAGTGGIDDSTQLPVNAEHKVQGCWVDAVEHKKHTAGDTTAKVKTVTMATMVSRLKKSFRRSGWYVSDDHSDEATDMQSTIHGIPTIAGHITRSHATSVWDYFGLKSAVYHSTVAQERAGHTKATFLKSYSRILPAELLQRWEMHPQNIYLSPDETIFI